MRARVLLFLLAASLMISANGARADVILTVGPNGQFQTINAATTFADNNPNNYYDIQVTPGTYTNDFSSVTTPMTIEAAPNSSGAVVLSATEALPNMKGIILNNSSLTVNGLTFQGAEIAQSDGGNGAGIRDQSTSGTSLIVENSIFLNDQEGVLTGGSNNQETVQILNSQFTNNGNPSGGGQEHALYIGDALSLLVNNSLFCGTVLGHDIKSRALSTTVNNSQIYVGTNNGAPAGCDVGSTSLGIDLPNGGQVDLTADQIFQGPSNMNGAMVSYGEEGVPSNYAESFMVSDTTFSSSVSGSVGIQELLPNGTRTCLVPVQLSNTSLPGVTTPVNPPGCVAAPNQVSEPGSFMLVSCALTGLFLVRWRPNGLRSAFGAPALRHSALIFWRRARNMIRHSSRDTAMALHGRGTGEREDISHAIPA
jgi:hypothetical protein